MRRVLSSSSLMVSRIRVYATAWFVHFTLILFFVLIRVTICLGPEIMSKLAGESESNLRKGNSSNFNYNIAVQLLYNQTAATASL